MLGIGHLLGDFYFQNEKMSKYKEEKYKGVILHSLEYCIAVILAFLPIFRSEVFWAVIWTVERFIMLLFLSKGQYAAIGFILTAKSIARYDKITKDEKFAEYYLLGILVSTLCVVICSKVII